MPKCIPVLNNSFSFWFVLFEGRSSHLTRVPNLPVNVRSRSRLRRCRTVKICCPLSVKGSAAEMTLPDLQVWVSSITGRALETGGPGVWVNYQTDGGELAACFDLHAHRDLHVPQSATSTMGPTPPCAFPPPFSPRLFRMAASLRRRFPPFRSHAERRLPLREKQSDSLTR